MANPAEYQVSELQRALAALSSEVATYVRETRADTARFKDEMAALNRTAEERMGRFEGEMRDFKDEMHDFKEEMHDFKDWARKSAKSRVATCVP